MYTGYGLVVGGALGLLVGTLLTTELWVAPWVGAGVGLIFAAIVDGWRVKDRRR